MCPLADKHSKKFERLESLIWMHPAIPKNFYTFQVGKKFIQLNSLFTSRFCERKPDILILYLLQFSECKVKLSPQLHVVSKIIGFFKSERKGHYPYHSSKQNKERVG